MAFSLNQSTSHVAIDEPNLVDVYRSTNRAIPPETLCKGHSCEAYICTSCENDLFKVFVAFFDTTTRRPIVFYSSCDARKKTDHTHLVNEALKLAASMGFNMEQVNLDYSTAMRQVIMRGIRVMRPPPPPRPAKRYSIREPATPEVPLPSVPQPPVHDKQPAGEDNQPLHSCALPDTAPVAIVESTDVDSHAEEIAELRSALEQHAREKAAAEKAAGELAHKLTAAEKELSALQLELEKLRQESSSAQESVEQRSALTQHAQDKAAAEKAAEELSHKLADAEKELSTVQLELEKLRQESSSAQESAEQRYSEETARSAREEGAAAEREQRMSDELASLRIEISSVRDTLKNTLKERQLFMNERDALRAELSVVKELAGTSRQNEREAQEQEREELKRCLQERETGLLELQKQYDTICVERELEQKSSDAGLKALTTRLEQLTNDKIEWHKNTANLKKKAQKALEQLKAEKQLLEEKLKGFEKKAVETPPEPIRTDTESQDPEGRSVAESPFSAPNATFSSFASGFAGSGVSSTSGSGAVFLQSPDIQVVAYRSIDEIVELYGSCNVVQTKLQDRKPQNCSAYVCVVEQEGKPAIHLAWHLIETGEVIIYLPEQQPDGAENYARTLQDALYYFEIAGFMMDRFELSPKSQRQLHALEKIGICRLGEPGS